MKLGPESNQIMHPPRQTEAACDEEEQSVRDSSASEEGLLLRLIERLR